MKKFFAPEMDVELFVMADVLTTSGDDTPNENDLPEDRG